MNIGDEIADFTLPGTDGEFRLSANRGRAVVLFFYPKDDTPGCTIEGGEFTQHLSDFTSANAVVLGVSADSIDSHQDFRSKFDYAHHLLSDGERTLHRQFEVGKRSTFLIDGEGKLSREWRDIGEVKGHAFEVLEAVRGLSAADS